MKFEELKKKLKLEIKPAYLIFGSDIFLKEKARELIQNMVVGENSELNSLFFSTDKLEPEKVIDACNTLPFFASKKLVVVKEYENKKSDSFVKKIEEYLKNSNDATCLVLIADQNSTYFDNLKKYAELVDCNPMSNDLVAKIIETETAKYGKKIELIARELLIQYCSSDLAKINNELAKLINYLGEEKIITADMVKENVSKDLEFELYELTNALGQKNATETYVILKTLKESKNATSALLSSIYRHFRRLFYISINDNLNIKELAEKLEVKEFAIKKASEQVKTFGAKKLKAINELCVEIEYKSKTGKLDAEEGLDFFILKILNL